MLYNMCQKVLLRMDKLYRAYAVAMTEINVDLYVSSLKHIASTLIVTPLPLDNVLYDCYKTKEETIK